MRVDLSIAERSDVAEPVRSLIAFRCVKKLDRQFRARES